jgi:hypothetical protein
MEPWSLWYDEKKITHNMHSTVYNIVHSPMAQSYWIKKKHLSESTFHSVHWDALRQAAKETSLPHRTFMIKALVGINAVVGEQI